MSKKLPPSHGGYRAKPAGGKAEQKTKNDSAGKRIPPVPPRPSNGGATSAK